MTIKNKYSAVYDSSSYKSYNIKILSEFTSISMDAEWYEIATANHFWLEWRLLAMLKQINQIKIPINKKLKVLEVGCGEGILRKSIESNTNWDVDAADINLKVLSKVQSGRGKTILYNIFDESDSLIDSYDVVLLIDVLEHIHDTKPFIISLIKHLKPGGYLLINVPALNTLFSVYDKKMGHFRRYNKKSLTSEFKEVDIKILDKRYWGLFMLPLLIIRSGLMVFLKNDETKIVKRGFKPLNDYVNRFFCVIARLETKLFSKPFLGTSLLLIVQK